MDRHASGWHAGLLDIGCEFNDHLFATVQGPLNTGAEKKPAKPVTAAVRLHQALPHLGVVVHDAGRAGELGAVPAADMQGGSAASAYPADF